MYCAVFCWKKRKRLVQLVWQIVCVASCLAFSMHIYLGLKAFEACKKKCVKDCCCDGDAAANCLIVVVVSVGLSLKWLVWGTDLVPYFVVLVCGVYSLLCSTWQLWVLVSTLLVFSLTVSFALNQLAGCCDLCHLRTRMECILSIWLVMVFTISFIALVIVIFGLDIFGRVGILPKVIHLYSCNQLDIVTWLALWISWITIK